MKKAYSSKWRSSVQPRKQRKYAYNAPAHVRGKQLHVHLSKELRGAHGTRAVRARSGDKVRVVRGTHKGKEGKVERVDASRGRLYVAKIATKKLQGGTAPYPLRPSNCVLIELVSDKKRRTAKLKARGARTSSAASARNEKEATGAAGRGAAGAVGAAKEEAKGARRE